ncbi:beta-ketoacyl-[acyl-carrier-protein] synthase family protein [Candidatus Woesearchaeota archaeon]|nr:beta-ketoacyl-[acyl-carrier-protein] synthase family protein [Candidatus Woesearchaeota archaeon]
MDSKDQTPVVVGMGVVSPAGTSVGEFAENLFSGEVGNIKWITRFDTSNFKVKFAAQLERGESDDKKNLEFLLQALEGRKAPQELVVSLRKGWMRMDDYTKDAIVAGVQAFEQAAPWLQHKAAREEDMIAMLTAPNAPQEERIRAVLQGCNSIPVIIGSGYGGLATVLRGEETLGGRGPSKVLPSLVQETMINSPTARLASMYQLLGGNFGTSNACASGTQAIIAAAEKIKQGAEGALVIGGDALVIGLLIAAFTNGGALSSYEGDLKKASRPWDSGRKGFVISEGAAALYMAPAYLAAQQRVKPLAVLAGFGDSADAPSNVNNLAEPNIHGPVLSMGRALAMAGLLDRAGGLSGLAYLNAHATATSVGDLNEARAIAYLLGEYAKAVPVGSTKSITGHMLGGAGVIESIACILALQRGLVPGNVNLDIVDDKIAATGINLPTKTEQMGKVHGPRYALSNSFGFGGANTSVLWKEA